MDGRINNLTNGAGKASRLTDNAHYCAFAANTKPVEALDTRDAIKKVPRNITTYIAEPQTTRFTL